MSHVLRLMLDPLSLVKVRACRGLGFRPQASSFGATQRLVKYGGDDQTSLIARYGDR